MNENIQIQQQFINQTLRWFGMDSQKTYEDHLRTKYSLLNQHGWINSNITYKFNNEGFRCDNFSEEPTILFLGCSITLGVGLPYDTLWTKQVSQELNLKSANLGVGGGSGDLCFRLGHYWIPRIKPKIVVFAYPPEARFELLLDQPCSYMSATYKTQMSPAFFEHWVSNPLNITINTRKNILGIRQICSEQNIKFFSFLTRDHKYGIDLARDLAHPGVECNKKIADFVISNL